MERGSSYFSRVAVRLGALLVVPGVDEGDRVAAAQWLLPLPDGAAPETGQSMGAPENYEPAVRAMATAAKASPEALAAIEEWNAKASPSLPPFRFLDRWL